MKSMKKAVLLVICACALVTAAVFGTLAYLTDQTEVVNTFTVGNVDIVLDETDVNPDGTPIEGADRVTENEYHLIPGQTYTKDPTVTVKAGSEPSYVRMMVTISDYSDVCAVFGDDFLPQYFVEGWDSDVWLTTEDISVDGEADTATYEFRYKEIVDASEKTEDVVLDALFDSFTLPGSVTKEQLAKLVDEYDDDSNLVDEGMKITVVGHAIQAVGFVDTTDDAGDTVSAADNAWAAFDAQHEVTE